MSELLVKDIPGAEGLEELVKKFNDLTLAIKSLEEDQTQLKGTIFGKVETAFSQVENPDTGEPGISSARTADGTLVTYREATTRDSLDRVLLVKAGVTPDQLQKGTKSTPIKASVAITLPRKAEE